MRIQVLRRWTTARAESKRTKMAPCALVWTFRGDKLVALDLPLREEALEAAGLSG